MIIDHKKTIAICCFASFRIGIFSKVLEILEFSEF